VWGLWNILFALLSILVPHHFDWSWDWREWDLPTMEVMQLLVYYFSAIAIGLIGMLITGFVKLRSKEKKEEQPSPKPVSLPLIGAEGEAFTSLRPGGKIQVQFNLFDAISEGQVIEKGEKVIVKKIRENVIIVAKKNRVDA
jgi:membrane-bound ClpP family serine protease